MGGCPGYWLTLPANISSVTISKVMARSTNSFFNTYVTQTQSANCASLQPTQQCILTFSAGLYAPQTSTITDIPINGVFSDGTPSSNILTCDLSFFQCG